jgi:hypothetical protein
VIEDKFVDLYARNSGLRDKLVAERDVVLTLRQLTDLELQVIADAKSGWNEPLADRLRTEIRELAAR